MIVPKGINFAQGGSWTAVLQWKDEGYVKDDDFAKTDFNEMLSDLKKAYKAGSDERVRGGYSKMELSAWAQPPHYDKATHKLYYAKLFDVGGPEQQLTTTSACSAGTDIWKSASCPPARRCRTSRPRRR
jgi:uncharacterized membrane-anchored protein